MEKRLQMSGESHTSVEDLVADLSAQKENTREEEPNESPVEQDELIRLQNLCVYFLISFLVFEIYLTVTCLFYPLVQAFPKVELQYCNLKFKRFIFGHKKKKLNQEGVKIVECSSICKISYIK